MRKGNENQIIQFLLANGKVRGAFIDSTQLVHDTQNFHQLGPVETLITGQMVTAAALISNTLKNTDRMRLQVECGGPIGGLNADLNADGDIRGYLQNNPLVMDTKKETTIDNLYGPGFLHLSRLSEGAKEPFVGSVELRYPDLASNLAYYYLSSEQTPTSFNLSVDLSNTGEYNGAAGLFLQLLPDAPEELAETLQELLLNIKSLYKEMIEAGDPVEWIQTRLKDFEPTFIGVKNCRFYCPCFDEQIISFLKGLGKDKLDEFKDEEGNISILCHSCGENRFFDPDMLNKLF